MDERTQKTLLKEVGQRGMKEARWRRINTKKLEMTLKEEKD